MSTQPRRSLRLRSSNLPDESMEPDRSQNAAVAPKRRVLSSSNPVTKSARAKNKTVEKVVADDVDVNENEAAMEERKPIVQSRANRTARQPRKREVSVGGMEEESDEEVVEKEEIPAKTRRMAQNAEDKVMKEDKEETKAPTVIQSNGRPRRGCVRRTTVEQYDDLMSGSASSSDVTSSESEVDDSDLEMEIKKAKRREGRSGRRDVSTQESSSDSDSQGEMDDEELENEEPLAKKGGYGRGSSTRSGGRSGKQRPKMHLNELPVEILHDKEYDVDYDEMVAWEAKSVKKMRNVRELERDRANGGQGMDILNEFILRCLKDGRMNEMDEKESIRLTHVHEEEVKEMHRRREMTVTQRIKEQVESEKQRVEKEEESAEDEDDEESEEMESVDGKKAKTKVEVRVGTKNKLIAPWKAKWIRQEVNKEVRQRCENIHKVHLLSYIEHIRHLMALANRRIRRDGGIPLSARALSLIPSRLLSTVDGEKLPKGLAMEEMKDLWRKKFTILEHLNCVELNGLSESERLDELMETGHFQTSRDAVVLFSSLASHLNIPLRIVARCVVVTKKPTEKTVEPKNGPISKNKKVDKKKEEENPTEEESVTYWCELLNEGDKMWSVFDPFLEGAAKKENNKGNKKKKVKGDPKEMISDFVKSWKSSFHNEPFQSCMEKDGPVLYFIAVDNDFGVRDVSSRYINGKDMISRELRGRRANEEWLTDLWENRAWRVDRDMAKEEDEEWMDKIKKMGMPYTVAAFKDHPLYVLDRDVLKMQIIFPYDTQPVGEISKYKIYLRKFVRPINTAKWFEKLGRQIMKDEPPCGEKIVCNPITRETGTQGLYGYWQTKAWDGGEVVEGRIPRNKFGNVYLYQPEMIPRGCIYLSPEGLQRVARDLNKDFVPAVIAWYYKGGSSVPLIRGAVFIKEDLAELLTAWKTSYKRGKEDENKGVLRLAAMRKKLEPIQNKERTVDEKAIQEDE